MKNSVIISDKEIMGGTPCFKGTRVPAEYLFGYLEGGRTIKEFLANYPSVNSEQAVEAIKLGEKFIYANLESENPS